MDDLFMIRIAERGVVTIPKALREAYSLHTGDDLTLIDLGGVFVLCPRRSEIDALADRIAGTLSDQGETLEGMLKALREAREGYDSQG